MSEGDLLPLLAEAGRQLSKGGAGEVASAIRAAGSPDKLLQRADGLPTPPQQKLAADLAHAWSPANASPDSVALALQSAQAAAEAEHFGETIELTWTGPKSHDVAVSRNDEALFQLIDEAQTELLVVSAFTWNMPAVVEKLSAAVDRGVDVRLVLEYHDNQGQPTGFDPAHDLGGSLSPDILIYQWPPEVRQQDPKTKKLGYLHVKCAVADRGRAFVSSANLTVYAMEMNMELGVTIRGGTVPERIAGHFEALINEGILQRVEG